MSWQDRHPKVARDRARPVRLDTADACPNSQTGASLSLLAQALSSPNIMVCVRSHANLRQMDAEPYSGERSVEPVESRSFIKSLVARLTFGG
jgi:hypothetical protein